MLTKIPKFSENSTNSTRTTNSLSNSSFYSDNESHFDFNRNDYKSIINNQMCLNETNTKTRLDMDEVFL